MRWIFAYGSLMWNPNFEYNEKKICVLKNYKRSFDLKATEHRGTIDNPGLVLTIRKEMGESCVGVCFGIEENKWIDVYSYLIQRELRGEIKPYKFVNKNVFENNKTIKAKTLLTDNKNILLLNNLTDKKRAEIISKAYGNSGSNIDYYLNTVYFLKKIGVEKDNIYNIEKYLK